MGKFVKGDIVVLPFPFSDLSSSKRRPALVLVDLKGNDMILCQITSKNIYDDMSVMIHTSDIENGLLNDTSNVRLNKLFTADENIILYKLGNLNKTKFREIIEKITGMFDEKYDDIVEIQNIEEIIYELESDFMKVDFCRDKDRLAVRLADDFIEFGQSGSRSDKQNIIDSLSQITEDRNIILSDFHIRRLLNNIFLATYRAKEANGRISNRSSIWDNGSGEWKILFHQGTIIPHE